MSNSDKQAYPFNYDWNGGDEVAESGLTKREYFAGLALQGLMVQSIPGGHNMNDEFWNKDRAKFAVAMADALLKELEK